MIPVRFIIQSAYVTSNAYYCVFFGTVQDIDIRLSPQVAAPRVADYDQNMRLDLNQKISTLMANLDNGVSIPHDLDAPHRFSVSATLRPTSRLTFGCGFDWRSGYPYTPITTTSSLTGEETYTPEYYRSALSLENSEKFPANGSLNFSGNYRMNSLELFFSVSNVTHRGNAIINAARGYVYDAGVLPNLGLRWSF